MGDLLQPAGPDAICAVLVFLHLLEGEAECGTQALLAHCKHLAAHAHAAANVLVGGVDIRRPWHDRHWAGPATAAADPWQGSDGALRRSRHWTKSKTLPAGKSTTATKAASTGSCAI